MVEAVFSGVIMGITALIMFGIGIFQLRSKEPVGFYSGEKPPSREQLTDVSAWNRKHGTMWILYGCCILAAWLLGVVSGNDIVRLIAYCVCLLLPIPLMILYHHRLIRRYMKQ